MSTAVVALAALVARAQEPAAPPAAPPILFHVPVVEAPAGSPLDLAVRSDDLLGMGQVELYYRRVGTTDWRSLGFGRTDSGAYVARVPGDEVMPPGIEYYIASRDGSRKKDRYASAASPHVAAVADEGEASHVQRELGRYHGQRSLARMRFEYVDFGAVGTGEDAIPDNWDREEFDFTYRILSTVRSLRFGAVRMRAREGEGENDPGLDHGFAEVEVAPHDYVGVKVQVQLGANAEAFTAGSVGTLRLGLDPGTHVDLELGGTGGVGLHAGMRLAWDTVPGVPMWAAGEVTDFPSLDPWAVRLLYEAEKPVGDHLHLSARATYQARAAQYGGIGGGLGMGWAF